MPDPTDEDLLARLRRGESDLFGPLIRRYERELFGYLRRYTGDPELAADVFQNTCVAIFTKIGQYEPGRAARPWIYTIATHQAIDAMRRRARRKDRTTSGLPSDDAALEGMPTMLERLTALGPAPEASADLAEQRELIREAVANLPELLKQVVLLTYFQGLKYQDAADVLGVPLGTVKSRLHAALAKLTDDWLPEDEA